MSTAPDTLGCRLSKGLAAFVITAAAGTGAAAPTNLLLESISDAGAGLEVFLASFNSYADVLGGSPSSQGFSQLDIASSFSVGGLD